MIFLSICIGGTTWVTGKKGNTIGKINWISFNMISLKMFSLLEELELRYVSIFGMDECFHDVFQSDIVDDFNICLIDVCLNGGYHQKYQLIDSDQVNQRISQISWMFLQKNSHSITITIKKITFYESEQVRNHFQNLSVVWDGCHLTWSLMDLTSTPIHPICV